MSYYGQENAKSRPYPTCQTGVSMMGRLCFYIDFTSRSLVPVVHTILFYNLGSYFK